MAARNRGKYAERKVSELFKKLKAADHKFDFIRLPDARAGRGAGKQIGDFQVFLPGHHVVVEVKEIEHDHLLPAKNITQLPKMRRREMAGGDSVIMIYHSRIKKWRVETFRWFYNGAGGSSWNLIELPLYDTAHDAWGEYRMGLL